MADHCLNPTARQIYDAQTGRPVEPPRARGGPMAILLCCFGPGGIAGAVKEPPAPEAVARREPSNKNSFADGAAKTPEVPLPPPPEAPTPKHTFEGGFAGPQEDAVLEPRLLARNSMELDTELIDLSNQWFGAAFMLKKSPTRKVTRTPTCLCSPRRRTCTDTTSSRSRPTTPSPRLPRPILPQTIHDFGPSLQLSISFLDNLVPLAERCGLSDAGAMMRVIMPQKETVSKNQGANKADQVAIRASLGELGLEQTEVDDVLFAATLLRSLVRMKIADKNDIGTARCAIVELQMFFSDLKKRSVDMSSTEWAVFQRLLQA